MPESQNTSVEWRVLIFGAEAAACGKSVIAFPAVTQPVSVSELKRLLQQHEPALARFLHSSRLAANHAFVGDDHLLTPLDELALIGTVSGG